VTLPLVSALDTERRPVQSPPWWTAAQLLQSTSEENRSPIRATASYLLGNAVLQVAADHPTLLDSFARLYGECAIPETASSAPSVRCVVRNAAHTSLLQVTFLDGAPLDPATAALGLLHPPRGDPPYAVRTASLEGWRLVGGAVTPVVAASGNRVLIDSRRVPDDFLVEYLVSATLEAQPELLVLHAAALQVRNAGILLAGPSRAGKTTTSAHLAARGHGLLGDEMTVIRMSNAEVLPLRRSVSLRAGPRAPELSALLARHAVRETQVAGGKTEPIRIDKLFPGSQARPVRLSGAFFLNGFAAAPAATPFRLSLKDANVFDYLAANDIALVSWGLTPARRALRLLALKHMLTQLPCWRLTVGQPAETAELIERTMGER